MKALLTNKILVVGGCGYIGGFLTDLLNSKENEWDVTVYDNLLYESRFFKNVKFICGDIKDTNKMSQIIHEFDVIVWLAAIVGDGACQIDSKLTTDLNENSVKWLVDNYKGKIVFTSTCSIYGINNDLLDEDAKPNPLSLYASTKLEAERYIMKNAKDPLVFRLGTLYGLGDEHSRIRLDLVVNTLTKKVANGEPLTVFGGEQWRPLLHVKDVAHAIVFCLENDIHGLFNLSADNYRINDIAETIKKVIPHAEIQRNDISFEDLRNYRVNNEKIKQTGWVAHHTIEEGIKEMLEVFNENRVKSVDNPVYSNEAYMKKLHNQKMNNILTQIASAN